MKEIIRRYRVKRPYRRQTDPVEPLTNARFPLHARSPLPSWCVCLVDLRREIKDANFKHQNLESLARGPLCSKPRTQRAETVEAWIVRGPGLSLGRMIEGYDPVTQALLGTLFTWGVTAAGSAVVFVFDANVCPATSRCATVVTAMQSH